MKPMSGAVLIIMIGDPLSGSKSDDERAHQPIMLALSTHQFFLAPLLLLLV